MMIALVGRHRGQNCYYFFAGQGAVLLGRIEIDRVAVPVGEETAEELVKRLAQRTA